jgi:hypothetical protein
VTFHVEIRTDETSPKECCPAVGVANPSPFGDPLARITSVVRSRARARHGTVILSLPTRTYAHAWRYGQLLRDLAKHDELAGDDCMKFLLRARTNRTKRNRDRRISCRYLMPMKAVGFIRAPLGFVNSFSINLLELP